MRKPSPIIIVVASLVFLAVVAAAASFFFDGSDDLDQLTDLTAVDETSRGRDVIRAGRADDRTVGDSGSIAHEPDASTVKTFELSVVTHDGRPVRIIGVRPVPHGEFLHRESKISEDRFAVAVPMNYVGDEVKVDLDGMPTQRVVLAPKEGMQEVRVSAKIEVTGQVWIKGAIPKVPLKVECCDIAEKRYVQDHPRQLVGISVPAVALDLSPLPGIPPTAESKPAIPEKAGEAGNVKAEYVLRADVAVTSTNAEGRFRFSGFSQGQRLAIVVKDRERELPVSPNSKETETIVEAPATNIIIDVDLRPTIVGKLTFDGSPQKGFAYGRLLDATSGKVIGSFSPIPVNSDGKFRSMTTVHAEDRIVDLEFGDFEGRFVLPKNYYGEFDAGEVVMSRIPFFNVTVTDSSGAPVPGAAMSWTGQGGFTIASSDRHGFAKVRGGENVGDLTINAFGRQTKVVKLSAKSGPVSVTLEAAPLLVAEIVGRSSPLPSRLIGRVRSEVVQPKSDIPNRPHLQVSYRSFYSESEYRQRLLSPANGDAAHESKTHPGTFEFRIHGDGEYSIDGLCEGQPVVVEILKPDGQTVIASDVVAMERGLVTKARIAVDVPLRRVSGIVVDEHGNPVRDIPVSVAANLQSPSLAETTTGGDGRFSFGAIIDDRVVLKIRGGPGRLLIEEVESKETEDFPRYTLP